MGLVRLPNDLITSLVTYSTYYLLHPPNGRFHGRHCAVRYGQAQTFITTIHALASDVASYITQLRMDNICRDTGVVASLSFYVLAQYHRCNH